MNIKESLEYQTECPACHVSWYALEDALYEGVDSESFNNAMQIIVNCHVCQQRFEKELLNYAEFI